MLLNLDKTHSKALYIQVYESIKEKILGGELETDEKLASKRHLAFENGISQNTVTSAYEQLLIEGYIYAIEKRGHFVSNIQFQYQLPPKSELSFLPDASEPLELLNPYKIDYDFTQSIPDKKLFPFTVFQKLFRNVLNYPPSSLLSEADPQGNYPLRTAIQYYLTQSRGVPCRAEQIILGPSSEYLLSILLALFEHKGTFGFENPGYMGFLPLLNRLNMQTQPINIDEGGVLMDELQSSSINLMCVTSNNQFPTGGVMPLARRQALLEWANDNKNRFIIENDYDSEFKYSGIPVSSLKYLDQKDKVIHLGSFTRVLSPGIRLSYMVLPAKLLSIYQDCFASHSSSLNTMMQWVMYEFIQKGHFETHLNRSRTFYKKKRDKLIQEIKKQDPKAHILGNKAGLHVLIQPSYAFQHHLFKEKAWEEGIRINVLDDYSVLKKEQNEHILFLNFSSIPEDKISQIVQKLFQLLNDSKLDST